MSRKIYKNIIINGRLLCQICQVYKNISAFYSFNALPKTPCKNCKKQYRQNNQIEINKYKKTYRKNNKNAVSLYKKNYKEENKSLVFEQRKKYGKANAVKISDYNVIYHKKRRENDLIFKLRYIVGTSINKALKRNNSSKNGISCLKYIDYDISQLREYLEAQFEPWMTWGNYGACNSKLWNDNDTSTWKWNIDHIIPQSKLPFVSMQDENFKKCWALENLRPYSAKQNIIDGNRR